MTQKNNKRVYNLHYDISFYTQTKQKITSKLISFLLTFSPFIPLPFKLLLYIYTRKSSTEKTVKSKASKVTMAYLFVLFLLFAARGEKVKFVINNCLCDMVLNNFHNYTGILDVAPPASIAKGTSAVWEYEYASRVEFGSVLNSNFNYYQKGETTDNIVHYYFNVNTTGGIFASIQGPYLGYKLCVDVPYADGTLPQVIGTYLWWRDNTTDSQCASQIPAINNCAYTVDF